MKMMHPKYILPVLMLLVSCSGNNGVPGGSGLIEATEAVISAEAPGKLAALYVDEGDDLNINDTIAMIDTVATMLRLHQVEALKAAAETQLDIAEINIKQSDINLSLAEKDYERVKSLIQSGSVNQQQYDNTETAYNKAVLAERQAYAARSAAQADLKNMDAEKELLLKQFKDCFPVAPMNGIVSDKFIEVGELANIGSPLIKIARLDTVWVKVYLPASDLTRIKLGDRAEIDPEDGRTQMLTGHITWISPTAEFTPKNVQTREARTNLVYAVKITIPNPDQTLKIGMPVSVNIQ